VAWKKNQLTCLHSLSTIHGLVVFRFKEKRYGSSSGATSGLTSSLAFTPVQVCSNLLSLCL